MFSVGISISEYSSLLIPTLASAAYSARGPVPVSEFAPIVSPLKSSRPEIPESLLANMAD